MGVMASGAGKAAQSPGPGSTVNGTAAEFPKADHELYDDQMQIKMCKKIAQLTKVRPRFPSTAPRRGEWTHRDGTRPSLVALCRSGCGEFRLV